MRKSITIRRNQCIKTLKKWDRNRQAKIDSMIGKEAFLQLGYEFGQNRSEIPCVIKSYRYHRDSDSMLFRLFVPSLGKVVPCSQDYLRLK